MVEHHSAMQAQQKRCPAKDSDKRLGLRDSDKRLG